MWPSWKLREYSLVQYLRECVWGLERVESRINMLRHAWSTPCFILEEDEPEDANTHGAAGPRSCLVPDSEDDDSPPLCLRYPHSKRLSCIPSMDDDDEDDDEDVNDDDDDDDDDDDNDDDDDGRLYTPAGGDTLEATHPCEKCTAEPVTPPPSVRIIPAEPTAHSPTQCPAAHAHHEAHTPLPRRPRVLYRARKTSLPIPIRIPEDSVAHHHTRYYTPIPCHFQRPPTTPTTPTPRQVRAWEQLPPGFVCVADECVNPRVFVCV